jgi:hypothetical protein
MFSIRELESGLIRLDAAMGDFRLLRDLYIATTEHSWSTLPLLNIYRAA